MRLENGKGGRVEPEIGPQDAKRKWFLAGFIGIVLLAMTEDFVTLGDEKNNSASLISLIAFTVGIVANVRWAYLGLRAPDMRRSWSSIATFAFFAFLALLSFYLAANEVYKMLN